MSDVRCLECGTTNFAVSGWLDLDSCGRCGASLARTPVAGPVVAGFCDRPGGGDALALAVHLAAGTGVELVLVEADEDPATELISAAAEHDARCIVIGTSHRGPIGRVLPGSPGDRLLRRSPCGVMIAPRGFAGRRCFRFSRFGVAYDGSPEARRALDDAAVLAADLGAGMRLLTVVREPTFTGKGWGGVAPLSAAGEVARAARRRKAEIELADALDSLHADVPTDAEAMVGDPVSCLVNAARDFDLLVMGSRGNGPLDRVLSGTVSGPVSRAADCPVLVIPRSSVGYDPGVSRVGSDVRPTDEPALSEDG